MIVKIADWLRERFDLTDVLYIGIALAIGGPILIFILATLDNVTRP